MKLKIGGDKSVISYQLSVISFFCPEVKNRPFENYWASKIRLFVAIASCTREEVKKNA
ncbi:MAG: hypothetical protein F6K40_27555 [Okeania sp. SIO3I5]|uniref:hypothetical protein n=1 Tax=Okeania sp. SIO3I5 TaxID=2607805 RepID=UPI0013BDFA87|nr:hypothetical protein [Okeania sp. SIO3I5]NEQ39802.1 hypothetical protein [Okeania sp. SIO3I5]